MTTQTTNLSLNKPAEGDTDWAAEINDNWDTLDDAVVKTIVDAKGDLLAGTGADAIARLAVGSDGATLRADSGEATGLKWTSGRALSVVSAYLNANQAIATEVWTRITPFTETIDRNGDFATPTFTAPQDGEYYVYGQIYFNAIANERYAYASIYVNGAAVKQGLQKASGTADLIPMMSSILPLSQGDTVELYGRHNHGANRNAVGNPIVTFLHIEGPI